MLQHEFGRLGLNFQSSEIIKSLSLPGSHAANKVCIIVTISHACMQTTLTIAMSVNSACTIVKVTMNHLLCVYDLEVLVTVPESL